MPKASHHAIASRDTTHVCYDAVKNGLLCKSGSACGKSFVRKGDLTRHRRIHTGVIGFQQKSQLTNHENVHWMLIGISTGNTPHQCDMCGEAFKDPSSCCRHRKEQHEGDYICFVDGCGKSIARKSNFRKHLGWHKVYNSGMELEDHWQRRDASMPKRVAHSRRPVKRSGSSDSESPCSLGVDNGSFYRI
ncbi:hypothetical protein FIBSPDRAFT_942051, partial [Athelia psychrophila]